MEPLTIPHPIKLDQLRGASSLAYSGRCVAVRLHNDDIDKLHEIADTLDIKPGTLMRWFIVFAMKELHKQHHNTEITVRP
jgi:hypothetical protein